MQRIPFTLFRSGSSKGPFFLKSHLPTNSLKRDQLISQIMGSNHPQQITGLGGGTSVTSKACVVSPCSDSNQQADVSYLFRQVNIDTNTCVDKSHGDCGNMVAGVACFALEKNLIQAQDPETICRVFSEATGALFDITIQTPNTILTYDGNASVPGVPGTASPVSVKTIRPVGLSCNGKMLPTGKKQDQLTLSNGKSISVTCADVSRPMVFVKAKETINPDACDEKTTVLELNQNSTLQNELEEIRLAAGVLMGMGDCSAQVSPKICIVDAPQTKDGALSIRYSVAPFRKEGHPSLAMTAGQCLASMSILKGTVVNEVTKSDRISHATTVTMVSSDVDDLEAEQNHQCCVVPIEHPRGVAKMSVDLSIDSGSCLLNEDGLNLMSTGYSLTVEPICEGVAFAKF